MQLRRLVLETSARKMLFPARDVSGLGEDVQVGAKATRNDRHLLAPVQGIEKQTNNFSFVFLPTWSIHDRAGRPEGFRTTC